MFDVLADHEGTVQGGGTFSLMSLAVFTTVVPFCMPILGLYGGEDLGSHLIFCMPVGLKGGEDLG